MSIGIGDALREAREQSGVRLADAAAETRIRQAHLRALEQEDFSPIGGDVYVKGFIRSYARHLGIDPEPLVRAYRDNFEQEEEDDWISGNEPVESPPPPRRPLTTIVVVLAVLTLGGLALLSFLVPEEPEEPDEIAAPDPVAEPDPIDDGSDDDGTDPDRPGGETSQGASDDEEADGDVEPEEEGPPALSQEIVLTLSVPNGRSWASIVVDGEQVEAANLESGYSQTYTGDEIMIRVGDAAQVTLEVNGEDYGQIGDSGAVVDIVCSTAAADCEIG